MRLGTDFFSAEIGLLLVPLCCEAGNVLPEELVVGFMSGATPNE
jgi:hypothetical protein